MKDYLECNSCGSVYLDIDNIAWKCRRCKNGGLLQDLRKYISENQDKLYKD